MGTYPSEEPHWTPHTWKLLQLVPSAPILPSSRSLGRGTVRLHSQKRDIEGLASWRTDKKKQGMQVQDHRSASINANNKPRERKDFEMPAMLKTDMNWNPYLPFLLHLRSTAVGLHSLYFSPATHRSVVLTIQQLRQRASLRGVQNLVAG